jgi:AcrR family transcriptional regulator
VYTVQYGVHVRQSRTDNARGEDAAAPRLSRERILATAIGLVAHEGEDALSMRRIGQELDVWPMSLYRYFHDKDALLDALAEAAAADINLPSPRGSWQRQLRALLHEVHATFANHAGGRRLRLTGRGLPPAATRLTEHACAVLRHAGLGPVEAQKAWEALVHYAQGAALQEDKDAFPYGLQLILDGIQAKVAPTPIPQEAQVA